MKNELKIFSGGERWHLNACVGDNGASNIHYYREGFFKSAMILIEQVKGKNGVDYPIDVMIYPIAFNLRHSLELYLKSILQQLEMLKEHFEIDISRNIKSTHSLIKLWNCIKKEAIKCGQNFENFFNEVDWIIEEFNHVDSEGQVFRYPFNLENRKHLVDIDLINLENIENIIPTLEKWLDRIQHYLWYIIEECLKGAYTKNLTPDDIQDLAHNIGETEGLHSEKCQSLKGKYNLSGQEFSKAIKIIQDHDELKKFAKL